MNTTQNSLSTWFDIIGYPLYQAKHFQKFSDLLIAYNHYEQNRNKECSFAADSRNEMIQLASDYMKKEQSAIKTCVEKHFIPICVI